MAKITLSQQEVAKAIANYMVAYFGYKDRTMFNIELKFLDNGSYIAEVYQIDEKSKNTTESISNLGGNVIPFKRK